MKGKLFSILLAVLLFTIVFSGCFEKISDKNLLSKETLYVGGSGPGNYSEIQDAIDNASDGDTVYIYEGTYKPFEYHYKFNDSLQCYSGNKRINFVGETYISISEVIYNKTIELEGQVLSNVWSKTTDSYCAGGSGYYILKTQEDAEVILEYSDEFDDYVNKTVIINGICKEKTIIPPDSSKGLQTPAYEAIISCDIFEVENITLIEDYSESQNNSIEITGIIRIPVEFSWSPNVGGCHSPSPLIEYENKTYYLIVENCSLLEEIGIGIPNGSIVSEQVLVTGELERKQIDVLVSKMPLQYVNGTCLAINVKNIEKI